jgi:phage FluMu protein Com
MERWREVRCEKCNAILYEEDIRDGQIRIKCSHCGWWNSPHIYNPELYTAVI